MRSALGQHDAALAKRAVQTKLQALTLSAEAEWFSALLANHGIIHHILKGCQLSRKLYGDLAMRHSRDIDVILEPRQLTEGLKVLKMAGWNWPNAERWLSGGPYRQLAESQLWHLTPTHPQYKSIVEIHWRFERINGSAREATWWAHWPTAGTEVSPAEALHLCLHGASHGWSRMKWLGDLRTLLDRQPRIWAESLPLAKELGLLPTLAQALLLLEWLYDVAPDAASRQVVASQPEAEPLAKFALRMLTGSPELTEWTAAQHLQFFCYQRSLDRRHGVRARLWATLSFYFIRSGDLLEWSLPSFLLCALPLIRVKGFIKRRWRRGPSPLPNLRDARKTDTASIAPP
jgi:hypothetical protein